MREQISTLKKKKKSQMGIDWSNILPKILESEEKATTTGKFEFTLHTVQQLDVTKEG